VIVPFACKDAYLERYSRPDKGWSDRDEARWPVPFWYVDTGMAVMSILLAVVDEGLGALYFGIAPEAAAPVRAAFGVPAEYEPVGAIAIGHGAETEPPDGSARRIPRRPSHEVVHYGRW
jgi:nitroreductase